MRKAPTIFLLVLSLLWHGFALAGGGAVHAGGKSFAHSVMHLENTPHHHHDDGTVHHDGSDESLQHVHADGCANATGLLPGCAALPAHAALVRDLFVSAPRAHDAPFLEGLRRPPRLPA